MTPVALPIVIDGIRCYAPEAAFGNDNYSPEAFERLYEAENRNFWFRSRNRVIRHLVRKLSKKKEDFNFLEIGCGTGYVLKGLSELSHLRLTGAEIYVKGLEFAKKRLPNVDFVQLDAVHMPYRDTFDAVGAFDVLEHIEEDEAVMKQVNLSLKPGGHFIISVPQYPSMWSYLDDMACHKRRYTRKEIRQKLVSSGYSIEYMTSFVFTLFPLMWIARRKKRKKREYDVNEQMKEIEISGFANSLFGSLMRIDEWLIKAGSSLPFGGSLVVVAKRNS